MHGLRLGHRWAAFQARSSTDDMVLAVMGLFACLAAGLIVLGQGHVVLAVAVLPVVTAVVWLSPRRCVYGLVVWMVMLGFLRRIVPGGTSATISGDPLILVGPFVLCLLVAVGASRGAFRGRSRTANAVMLLTLVALVEAANPLQGGFKVGLGGVLYVLIPMLAFWVGRVFLDRSDVRRIMLTVAVLAFFNSLYGLFQTLVGFPPWDSHWIHSSGYQALTLSGTSRAFGTCASGAEYAFLVGIGLVLWVVFLLSGRIRNPILVLGTFGIIGVMATALVLEAGRGTVVTTAVAVGLVVAARMGRKLGGATVATVTALALLVFIAGQFTPTPGGTGTTVLTNHLVTGLAHPGSSDLPNKIGLMFHGMSEAITNPLGHGTGSITIAVHKLGHLKGGGVETDPGNAAVAFGIVGLLLYLVVLVRAVTGAYGLAARRRDLLALGALGMITVPLLQMLNGDLYSVCWLVWLMLGWIDVSNIADRSALAGGEPGALRPVAVRAAAPTGLAITLRDATGTR